MAYKLLHWLLSYFYAIKIAKLYAKSLLIWVSISIGNRPRLIDSNFLKKCADMKKYNNRPSGPWALGMKYTKVKAFGLAIPFASINRFGKCYYHYVLNFKTLLNNYKIKSVCNGVCSDLLRLYNIKLRAKTIAYTFYSMKWTANQNAEKSCDFSKKISSNPIRNVLCSFVM